MVTPVQSPPLEPAAEAPPPSPPASHKTTDTSIAHSPENPAPPPPPPTQPNLAGGPSPALPPETPTPPPPPNAHASTLSSENQPPAPLPPSADPPPTAPAPASADAKVEPEAAEATGESENLTLALALTLTKDATPPLPPSTAAAVVPNGSPPKETTLTIAKLLSGEDSTAAEVKPPPEKAVAGGNGGAGGGRLGSKRWLLGGLPEKVRRAELRRAELGFRVSAAVLCLVSLSVMASDSTPGWAGDSFRRYNEYRYSLAASVAAFTYSAFQVVSELHYIVTGKHIIGHPWGNYFNLAMDQVLAYLLLSASSAALSRNGVWVSRFGGDQFTKLINVSASMAFLAFIALGLSSIVSAFYVFSSIS